MKGKTIKTVLRKKFDEWTDTIEDKLLQEKVREGSIVTGGCIASMLLGVKIHDYDIYFKSKVLAAEVARYYVARFSPEKKNGIECKIYVEEKDDRVSIVVKSAGVASEKGTDKAYEYFEARPEGEASEYVSSVIQDPGDIEDTHEEVEGKALETKDEGKPKYRPVFLSTNAITLANKVQLILRFYGSPDDIHANYDFVHCTNYWTSWDSELVLRPAALESLLSKDLYYVGSKYPVCSIFRLKKFLRRGWTINAGQMLKMVMQVSELDLTNYDILRDQLTGVDVAYFSEVLKKIHDKDPSKINAAYLIEIVNRMF